MVAWDDRKCWKNVIILKMKWYTKFCITVDFDSLKDGAVAVRDRDTMKQERIKIGELKNTLAINWMFKNIF